MSGGVNPKSLDVSFQTLITSYQRIQTALVSKVKAMGSLSHAQPGQFIMLQFQMANVTQIGESISNLIGQVNKVCSNAISQQQSGH